jgi:2-(1,2-epoxy-1,2-dihydrophenyl)acetyl-CoA isomerase
MWLESEDRDRVRWLRINRPERKNAIPADGWTDLVEHFSAFDHSSQRVLVVTGSGGSFSSGADLDPDQPLGGGGVVSRQRHMKGVAAAAIALHRIGKPTIAAVDGVAAGAGMNLALGCDLVIASTRARFSEIFVRRGLTLDFGGSWLLPRIVGLQRAKELALSGRMVDAEEALGLGLVLEVVAPEQLEVRATELAAGLLEGAPVGQMFAKQALNRSHELTIEQALAWEGQSQAICLSTEDVLEGVEAFRQKRKPDFKGR